MNSLEILDASPGATWQPAVRQNYNAFVLSTSSALVLPLSVRLTDVAGYIVTNYDAVTNLIDDAQFHLDVQFPPCELLADGFESGDTSAWSHTGPAS